MEEIVEKQRNYFLTHETKDVNFRKKQLENLRTAILKYERELYAALYKDFKKSEFETYETEIGMALEEIRYVLKKIDQWAKPQRVSTPMAHFRSTSKIYAEPYGVVLIMSPWNYPFLLTISPLIGAIAAGNCTIIKTSRYASNMSHVISKMIEDYFSPEYLTVIEGGRDVNQALLNERWDYIFFTGSPNVGKMVMEAASKHLTPVTLELGGKSPCIVDETADIRLAAKRIAWGKLINAGQTCVAPDYILAHNNIKEHLIEELKKVIQTHYSEKLEQSNDFPRVINEKHFQRLVGLIDDDKVAFGGQTNKQDHYIAPTIMNNVTWEDAVMQEEIFGPIIPILAFETIDQVIDMLNQRPKPLALYYFSNDKNRIDQIVRKVSYGGGCINDTIVHLANLHMPFGGVGNSGMGGYHGKYSFDTFSHYKGVLKKANWIDMPFRYPPYKVKNLSLIKRLMK